MKGWVYVITNKAMPGLVKVGFSMQDPSIRAKELAGTGIPHPYEVEYEVLVDDPRNIERSAHQSLADFREGKEWFRCDPEVAINAIREVVGSSSHLEEFKGETEQRSDDLRAKQDEEKRKQQAEISRQREIEYTKVRLEDLRKDLEKELLDTEKNYDAQLQACAPNHELGLYWLAVYLLILLACGLIYEATSRNVGLSLVLANAGLVIAYFVAKNLKSSHEMRAKESVRYKSLLREKDAALKKIRSKLSQS